MYGPYMATYGPCMTMYGPYMFIYLYLVHSWPFVAHGGPHILATYGHIGSISPLLPPSPSPKPKNLHFPCYFQFSGPMQPRRPTPAEVRSRTKREPFAHALGENLRGRRTRERRYPSTTRIQPTPLPFTPFHSSPQATPCHTMLRHTTPCKPMPRHATPPIRHPTRSSSRTHPAPLTHAPTYIDIYDHVWTIHVHMWSYMDHTCPYMVLYSPYI